MKVIYDIVVDVLKRKNGFKKITWLFIILILFIVVFYPIIDANFLYYGRTQKRIELIKEISELDQNVIQSNTNLEKEYNSILDDMQEQRSNQIGKLFHNEDNQMKNIFKALSGGGILLIIGFILPFTKDNNGKRKTNIIGGVFCIFLSIIVGYFCIKIPNIISFWVNIVLNIAIWILLGYTIISNNKKDNQV